MILSIGEILFDVFPGYKRLGGAPFNFAYHMKQLGLPSRFISRVGNDAEGKIIFEKLQQYGFEPDCLQMDDKFETGKVRVGVDENGKPDFNILPNTAYDNLEFNDSIQVMLSGTVDLIYIGSLAQRSRKGFTTIQHILNEKRPQTKLLYDVNLRPRCYSRRIVTESLKHTDILKLNDDELHTIKDMLGFKKKEEAFVEFLRNEFSIEMVALTKGEKGSEIYSKDQHTVYRSRKLNNIVDTVGAGDGFASILAIGYLLDWFPHKILSVATSFAEEICKVEGAILLDNRFYEHIKVMIEQPENVT